MSPERAALIWDLAKASLEQGCPVMLLYVVESTGSSPGRQGFFMVVNARGEMAGSIGGGIMEHKFTEMAIRQLAAGGAGISLRRQVHDDSVAKDRSGMICSGEQMILFYTFRREDCETVARLLVALRSLGNGTLRLSAAGMGYFPEAPVRDYYYVYHDEKDWLYEERMGYKQQLYIVGAGHCSAALSGMMRGMDFYITVMDHRSDLSSFRDNREAHEKIVVPDYAALGSIVDSGPMDHYVVIMTQGYRTDDLALRALMHKDFRYISLLGSKAKIARMMEGYRREGVAEDRLRRIHAPAGLAIHSQTPEEIAVSIAAEIIFIKNS